MAAPYKVLVISGGGVFGVIPAALLASEFKEDSLIDTFDCFSGTSIGGVLSLCYADGMNAQNALHDFKSLVKKAFPEMPWWWRWNPLRTKYDNKDVERVLRAELPVKLGELKAPVVIPAVDFEYNRPKVFDTLVEDGDSKLQAWAVARATSAAPTYFPPFMSYVDGSLMANCPVLEAVAAIKAKKGIDFEDMHVMVLGTGKLPDQPRDMRQVRHWSRLHWVKPLLRYISKANEFRSTFVAKQLGLGRLEIFNPVLLEKDWDIDRVDLVPVLEAMATQHKRSFSDACKRFFKK